MPGNVRGRPMCFDEMPDRCHLAVGETVILMPLPFVGVSIAMERGCQYNDSLADGYCHRLIGAHLIPQPVQKHPAEGVACMTSLSTAGRQLRLLPVQKRKSSGQAVRGRADPSEATMMNLSFRWSWWQWT